MPEGRCCIECVHLRLQMTEPRYSEVTPGPEFRMWCEKDVWKFERYGTEEEYRNCILAARTCDQFQLRKEP